MVRPIYKYGRLLLCDALMPGKFIVLDSLPMYAEWDGGTYMTSKV